MPLKAALFWFCCFCLTERGSAAVTCRRLHAAVPPEVEPPQRRWALLRPLSYLNDNECDPVTGITLNNYVTSASGLCVRPLFIYYLSSLCLSNILGSLAYIFIAILMTPSFICLLSLEWPSHVFSRWLLTHLQRKILNFPVSNLPSKVCTLNVLHPQKCTVKKK